MKKHLRRLKASVFARYVLSYVTLLALILTGLSSFMYRYVDAETREKALATQVNRLSRIAREHEDWLNTMMNSAVQIGLSPYIEPFAYQQQPARAYDLLRQLAPYTVTNSFCEQMYLCFTGDDHIYSSDSSMTLDMFLSLVHYEHASTEELLRLIRAPGNLSVLPTQRVESSLIDGTNPGIVTFFVPLAIRGSASKGTLVFLLQGSAYHRMFSDAMEENNNTYIFYGDQVLAAAEDFPLPPKAVLDAAKSGEGYASVPLWENGEAYYVQSIGDLDWGMRYVSVMPAAQVSGSIARSMTPLVVSVLSVALLGVSIALLLARRNAQPIRELTSLLPQKPDDADDLGTIQSGIRELSRRNSDLSTRLERSLPLQRHAFVLRLMKGRYLEREEAVQVATALDMEIDKPYYAVVLSGAQERSEQPLDLRQEPFASVAGAVGYGVELVALKAQMYLVLADEKDAIGRMAELIRLEGLERNGHAIVALSGIQTDFAQAPTAYLEAASAFDNRFVMDEGAVLDYATISTSVEDILPQARKITSGINQALLMRRRDMLSDKLEELLHFLKHNSMSPFAFRMIYNDVINTLLQEHAAPLARAKNARELYDIFSLSSCQSVEDLDTLLRQLCASILSAEVPPAPSSAQEEQSAVIRQVVDYMGDHFTEPELSISAIAEAFEMPTARLSLAFKELTKMSPLEYLTLLRVERSKTLLSSSEMSIKEVAAEVGYYDASSFIRRFKQMTGQTPLQYRRSKEATSDDVHVDP